MKETELREQVAMTERERIAAVVQSRAGSRCSWQQALFDADRIITLVEQAQGEVLLETQMVVRDVWSANYWDNKPGPDMVVGQTLQTEDGQGALLPVFAVDNQPVTVTVRAK